MSAAQAAAIKTIATRRHHVQTTALRRQCLAHAATMINAVVAVATIAFALIIAVAQFVSPRSQIRHGLSLSSTYYCLSFLFPQPWF